MSHPTGLVQKLWSYSEGIRAGCHNLSLQIVMSNPAALVQKLWNYCNILRDDGLSYGDDVEPPTFLLFLKMGA